MLTNTSYVFGYDESILIKLGVNPRRRMTMIIITTFLN